MVAPESPGDAELLRSAEEGDEKAFETLYLRHRGYVLALSARFGVAGDDAFDVLQDTFFLLVRRLPGFKLTCKLSTYLYPMVKHLCIKKRVGAARFLLFGHPDEMEDLIHAQTPSSAFPLPQSSSLDAGTGGIEAVVARLPQGQREVILLRFVDDFSLEEIALALKIPLGTVKSRLHNALTALRNLVRKGG